MAKQGGGFGIVMLVVVVAIVLLLVAQAWRQIAPSAIDLDRATAGGPVHAHGEDAAARQLRSGELPKLADVTARTDAHSEQVRSALADSE